MNVTTHPTVTAVISCYNAEQYIKFAVQSLFNQSYGLSKIIVIDDGSTDNSLSSLNCFLDSDIFELRVNASNMGRAASINATLDSISSKYVLLLDADDIAHANRIEKQVSFMESNPSVGCSSSFIRYINTDGRVIGHGELDITNEQRFDEYLKNREPFGLFCPSVIIRTEVFRNKALRFRDQFWPADDIDLWNRIAESGWKVLAQSEYLTDYRVHKSSAVTSNFMFTRMRYEYVRACLRSRRSGFAEPTWDEFLHDWNRSPFLLKVNRWRKAAAKQYYRMGGFSFAENMYLQSCACLVLASILQPLYTFPRLIRQFKHL